MKEEPISSLFDVASFFSHMGYSKYHLFLQSYSIYRCFFFILKIEKKKKGWEKFFYKWTILRITLPYYNSKEQYVK